MPYSDPEKQREYQREWARAKDGQPNRSHGTRPKRRRAIQELKESQPCTDCKIKWPYYVMQWDHVPERGSKVSSINERLRDGTWEEVLAELEKCDLVCANCHRIRTHQRQQAQ